MGIGRRLFELARANLNAVLDRAARHELEDLTEAQLQAELERRRGDRATQEEERQRRIDAEAAAKQRSQARPPAAGEPKRDARTRGAARRAGEATQRQARIEQLCRTLGVAPGTPPDQIKRAYRALMREHHPDRHSGNATKQRAASQRAAEITTAYAELETLLAGGRR